MSDDCELKSGRTGWHIAGWFTAGAAIGLVAGWILWGASGFSLLEVDECNGAPIRVHPARGFSAHGLYLFVGGIAREGPIELSLEGYQAPQYETLDPNRLSDRVSFSYVGPWSGPFELRVRAPESSCHLYVVFHFRGVPIFR